LVHGVILPKRSKRSAEAYKSIWTEEGSPLLSHSRALASQLEPLIAAPLTVVMRYGSPSIEQGVGELLSHSDLDEIVIAPLFPQYARATFQGVIDYSTKVISRHSNSIKVSTVAPFYKDEGYLTALTSTIGKALTSPFDHLLLSFHGLPERHIKKADPTGTTCLQVEKCCVSEVKGAHDKCYRAQAYFVSREVGKRCEVSDDRLSVSFQSRLGKDPWLEPFTDQKIKALAMRGVKRLVVACPSFVTDCLETLEEIGIAGKNIFLENGGKSFELVPCLNEDPGWIKALAKIVS